VWEFTCPDTFAPNKYITYRRGGGGGIFVPVAIDTIGVWGSGASDLIRDLGGWLAVQLGDPQPVTHFKQRLDVAGLRENAFLVMGTFPEEFFTPRDTLLVRD